MKLILGSSFNLVDFNVKDVFCLAQYLQNFLLWFIEETKIHKLLPQEAYKLVNIQLPLLIEESLEG